MAMSGTTTTLWLLYRRCVHSLLNIPCMRGTGPGVPAETGLSLLITHAHSLESAADSPTWPGLAWPGICGSISRVAIYRRGGCKCTAQSVPSCWSVNGFWDADGWCAADSFPVVDGPVPHNSDSKRWSQDMQLAYQTLISQIASVQAHP